MIADVTGFEGRTQLDPCQSDGTARKLLDISTMTRLGWTPQISLRDGLASTYAWYCAEREAGRILRAS